MLTKLLLYLKKIFLLITPALLIYFNFSLIGFLQSFDFLYIKISTIYSFFLLIGIIYWVLYKYLNITRSVYSFIAFFLNASFSIIYIRSFSLLQRGLPYPIYLTDLSLFSQYRYLVLVVLSFFGFFCYLLSLNFKGISAFLSFLKYPYLKEEIRKILYTWNQTLFGPICSYIIDHLNSSAFFTVFYFSFHFLFFFVFRILMLYFLFLFVFFNGDLRLLIYCLPLSFVIWILRFLEYYFIVFFGGSLEYVNSVLILEFDTTRPLSKRFGLVELPRITYINLTPLAIEEGFAEVQENINFFYKKWVILARLSGYFKIYNRITTWISYFILIFQFLLWSSIVLYFFIPSFSTIFNGFFPLIRNQSSVLIPLCRSVTPLNRRQYAREAFWSTNPSELASKTKGSYSEGHPVIADKAIRNPQNPKEISYNGSLTHGRGSPENLSVLLDAQKDLTGTNRSQYFIPPMEAKTYINEGLLHPIPIKGSEPYLEKRKQIIEEHLP